MIGPNRSRGKTSLNEGSLSRARSDLQAIFRQKSYTKVKTLQYFVHLTNVDKINAK